MNSSRFFATIDTPQIGRKILMATLLTVSANICLHFFDLQVLATLFCTTAIGIRWWVFYVNRKLPKKWIIWLLIPVALGITQFEYRTLTGQEASTSFLVMLMSLKLLETVNYRDVLASLLLAIILLASKLLVDQTLLMTVVLIADVILINGLLLFIHQSDFSDVRFGQIFKSVSKMLLQTSPLVLLLFFVFPRFSIGLWGLNNLSKASSGFDDVLQPGEIETLMLSNELAFRARFIGEEKRVNPDRLYWRGAVLWNVDGMKWSRSGFLPMNDSVGSDDNLTELQTEILLEPRFGKWLFAPELPFELIFTGEQSSRSVKKLAAHVFEMKKDLGRRLLYQTKSENQPKRQKLTEEERALFLSVKPSESEKVNELVGNILAQTDRAEEKADRVIDFFSENRFRYTLKPATLSSERPLEDFLFKTRQGFCEHFAASFSILMRYLEVPSRVVIGFQGGKYNAFDNYYIVTDRDAHAWSEYWSDEKQRWVRLDPTETIAPLRISLGGQDFFGLDIQQYGLAEAEQILRSRSGWRRMFESSFLVFDAIANRWNLFLIKYDFNYQKKWLREMGIAGGEKILLIMLSSFGIFISFVFYRNRSQRTVISDGASKQYQKLCSILVKNGFPEKSYCTPREYYEKCRLHQPAGLRSFDRCLGEVFDEYEQIRYNRHRNDISKSDLQRLGLKVKALERQLKTQN